jgi:hypothetical protein
MGSTQLFYALSVSQDLWKERINLFIALAPVTRLNYSPSELLTNLAKYLHSNTKLFRSFGINEVFTEKSKRIADNTCGLMP